MDPVGPSVAFQGVYSSPGKPFPTRDSYNIDPPHQSAPHGLVSVPMFLCLLFLYLFFGNREKNTVPNFVHFEFVTEI